jgi:hypothetical protein
MLLRWRAGCGWGLAVALAMTWAAAPSIAGEPAIRNVNVRGLQIGGPTTLVVDGDDLGSAPKLLLAFPAKQELKTGGTDKQATFEVTAEAGAIPGYYQLRVVTDGGVSLPVVIGVDALPQLTLPTAIESLPVALHATLGGSTVLETSFAGKAGQTVFVEIEAQRLGGKLRPVLHLYDAKRRQLAWAWTTPALSGDARLEAVLPADGQYVVTMHELEYAAPQPGFFRLKIGQWSSVESVFPSRVALNQLAALELIALAKAVPSSLSPQSVTGEIPLSWPGDGLWSGPRPYVEVTSQAQLIEQPTGGLQDLPAGPVDVNGRLVTAGEEDRYRIPVTPGSKLRLEVFAERLRSPLDVALVIRNDKGDVVVRGEDSPDSLDPLLDYVVPAQVTALTVGVVDAQGRGSPRGVYRLQVRSLSEPTESDFELVTPSQRLALGEGATSVVPVFAQRRGYEGPIEITATNLPAGLSIGNATIPEGADGTLVTVARRGAEPAAASIINWQGRNAAGQQQVATVQGHPTLEIQPWLAREVALAPTAAKQADFTVDYNELPVDAALRPAGKLTLPVKLTHRDPTLVEKSKVRLTLLTSQLPPLNNKQVDTNRQLRAEKPIELPAATVTGEVVVLAPSELPGTAYDVAVQAELLGPDNRPTATTFTAVRRLAVKHQLAVQLAAARMEVPLDAKTGAMIKVEGKVERREGLTGDVVVALTGLPEGARADTPTVKADVVDFVVNVVLTPTARIGQWRGLALSASGVPDPAQANVRVRSRDVPLTLVVQPPPATP